MISANSGTRKIVVGMSGGVDSSITVLLLKKQGWEPVGVSLKLAHWNNPANILGENACCTVESLNIAKEVCKKLDVPYHQYDVSREFKKEVMDYFVSELKQNRTPNPCVICNKNLKFRKLFEWAHKHGIKYVASGHYAKTRYNPKTKKIELIRPKDLHKDQTYGLSYLPQKWLKFLVFPLGDYTKKEVYALAKKEGFEIFLKKKQSQDLCFVSSKALPKYLEEKIGIKEGLIVDEKDKIVGKHRGLHFYTIGQRKGLALNGKYYVKSIDTNNNTLIVTKNKNRIGSKKIVLCPFHLISEGKLKKKSRVEGKVRYSQPLTKATLRPLTKEKIEIVFEEIQHNVASGQFCVFYKGEVCLGCGIIID